MLGLRRLAAYAIDWFLFAVWATAVLAVVLATVGSESWTDDPWLSQALGALFVMFWKSMEIVGLTHKSAKFGQRSFQP